MQTFEALDGNSYPFSQIACVRKERRTVTFVSRKPDGSRSERQGEVVVIDLLNDRTVEVETYILDSWDLSPVSTFAAGQGTSILYLDDEEDSGYYPIPVLGWAVARDSGIYPITADGVNDGNSSPKPVLLPTGQVVHFSGTYDSVERWLESQKKLAEG